MLAPLPASHTYIALLRAINVGGTSVVKMGDVRARLEDLGLGDVRTHLQTGNVVFTTGRSQRERLRDDIAKAVAELVPSGPTVFLLTPAELRRAAEANPFAGSLDGTDLQCVLLFLDGTPTAGARRKLAAQEDDTYAIAVRGSVVYYTYSKATAGRRRTIDFEGILGRRGTARTHRVVAKLIEIADA